MKMLFLPGKIVSTPGALELLELNGVQPIDLIMRHLAGDWGDLSPADIAENELSIREGFRILSSYNINGSKVWVITEHDRSATTFLLPSEY